MPLPSVSLTRERLWFLHCLADFGDREMAVLTGWPDADISDVIHREGVDRWRETRRNAQELVRTVVLHTLIMRHEEPFPREVIDATERKAIASLQRLVSTGELSWEQIDALMTSLDRQRLLALLARAVDQALVEESAPS